MVRPRRREIRPGQAGELCHHRPGVDDVINGFHRAYYDSRVWTTTAWLSVPTQKCPLDLWIYQELLTEFAPDLIVETGTADGGSALFLANVCDLLSNGRIVTIDVLHAKRPAHPRVRYLTGSSIEPGIVAAIRHEAQDAASVLVVLDSDHSASHVLAELDAYAPLVTPGSYLIVEDTNVNGHPVLPEHGPGPAEALQNWLPDHPDFEVDRGREKFGMTFNPGGYLRRR
jgi:cephalosporin hydroxylase